MTQFKGVQRGIPYHLSAAKRRHGMSDWRPGRALLTGIAVLTAVGGYAMDMNRTHMYNPRWMPHAKFHDAQTMLMGTLLGVGSLVCLWRKGGDPDLQLALGAWLPACFWISQAGSILLPNTAVADPEYADAILHIGHIPVNR